MARPLLLFLFAILLTGPHALSPSFESKFAILQYVRDGRFNLAYFRHTGEWWEVAKLLSLQEYLS
jgi:hypothetical protein